MFLIVLSFRYQQSPYWLEPLPFVRDYLLNVTPLTEAEMFEKSYAIVPNLRKGINKRREIREKRVRGQRQRHTETHAGQSIPLGLQFIGSV